MIGHERARLLKTAGLNATLRVAALASKLFLLIYIARYLSVADMAIYGLLTTSVGIAVTLLGLEFYAFSQREILASKQDARATLLRDQFVLYGVGYLLLVPLSLPLFFSGLLPWQVAVAFYVLTIFEHLAQETARLFNVLFRPLLSTALFFVRSASWGYAVMGVGLFWPAWRTLNLVLGAWVIGVLVSVVISIAALARMYRSTRLLPPVDWAWIRRGLFVAVPFMISAVSYRVMELADRYIIHFLLDETAVAVYSFFGTLANVVPAVVGAGITSVLTPRILDAYLGGRMADYRKYFRTMALSAAGLSLASVPVGFFAIALMLPLIGKNEYRAELRTCAVLLLSTAVAIIAQLPGTALYARKDDRALLTAVVIGAVLNTALNFVLIPAWGIIGAAWATLWAYAAMGVYQLYRVFHGPRVPNADGIIST